MILDAYYGALRELLATGNPDKVATKIGFGTGTEPERKSDTALTDPIIKELSGYEFDPDDPRLLRVNWRLLRGEANGLNITEIGLYTADETLIVRKVRSAIEKTPDMEFGDTWEILI